MWDLQEHATADEIRMEAFEPRDARPHVILK